MTTPVAVELDGQYRALREGAGVVERRRAMLRVSGADAAEYLQAQVTNDVEALDPGRGCYAALLDRKGHIEADMRVLRLAGDQFLLDAEAVAADALRAHLERYKIGRQVELADIGADFALLSVIGPAAHELAGVGPLSPEGAHREHAAGRAVATDLGVDLVVPRAEADALRRELLDAGVAEVSEQAAEILRVESGRPRYGAEMSIATMPAEAGIDDRAVSFTKGCYIGQEPVARLHYKGRPNRRLRGLTLSAPVDGGEEIRLAERVLGTIATACISPALGPIALAIVRREAEPGDTVEVGDGPITAEVVELPFRDG